MSELSIFTTDGANVRIIRPLEGEPHDTFRERMQRMIEALRDVAPEAIAVVLDTTDGCPVCVINQLRVRPGSR